MTELPLAGRTLQGIRMRRVAVTILTGWLLALPSIMPTLTAQKTPAAPGQVQASPIQRYGVGATDKAKQRGVGRYKVTQQADSYVVEMVDGADTVLGYAALDVDNAADVKRFRYRPASASSDVIEVTIGPRMQWVQLVELSTGARGRTQMGEKTYDADAEYTRIQTQYKAEVSQLMEAAAAVLERGRVKPAPSPKLNPAMSTGPGCNALVGPALFVADGKGNVKRGTHVKMPSFLTADVRQSQGPSLLNASYGYSCNGNTCRGLAYAYFGKSDCCDAATQTASHCCSNQYTWGCCSYNSCDGACALDDFVCGWCGVTGRTATGRAVACSENWDCYSNSCGWDGWCR